MGPVMSHALLGLAVFLAGIAVGVRIGWAVVCIVLGVKKRHWLCAGNGCRICKDGRVYRSALAGWMRRRK